MPSTRTRRDAGSTRAFRALLTLYPPGFRDEYGRELVLVFADRYRAASSRFERVGIWIEALIGVLAEAPGERARTALHDLRYAWRVLRRNAAVTATIVITLALGIGANTAMFSLVHAVALRTLPVARADELVVVNSGRYVGLSERSRLSGPMFERLRQAAPAGVKVAAMSRGVARVHTRRGGEDGTSPANLQLVSSSYFDVLGVATPLGRGLGGDADAEDAEPMAVISHAYWQRRFGGAADAIGRTLTINGAAFTVVGVGPPDFAGVWLELPADIWVPLAYQGAVSYSQDYSADGADLNRRWLPQDRIWWLHVIARVPPDRQATVADRFTTAISELTGRRIEIVLEPFANGFSKLRQQFSLPLMALAAMAALVLLIACANVANLLLARAASRQREIGVRLALGAGRARLVQQLLAESVLMVAMAAAAAIVVARWASQLLLRMATAATDGPPPLAATVDLTVLAFTAVVAFGSVLLFGLVPAWRGTRVDLVNALKSGGRAASGATRPARALVVVQVALSLVLVTGMGLLVQSFRNLTELDPGFRRRQLLSITIDPRLSTTPPPQWPQLNERVLDVVRALPGIESAALAQCGVQSGCRARESGMLIEGYQPRPDEDVGFLVNAVSPGYFETMGMRLLAGRTLTERDVASAPKVAVVTRTLADSYFRGAALGRRFGLAALDVEIVGVVDDVRAVTLADAPPPMAYFALAQRPLAVRALEVRARIDLDAAALAVRRAVTEAAPDLPIEAIVSMDDRVRLGLSQPRMVVYLTSAFGLLALALAGFGLFGVLSYAVARRTVEFGVRMALGASRADVLRSVVGDGLRLVLAGVVLGLPVVLLGGRLLSTLIYGVSVHDVPTLAAAAAVLFAVGAGCGLLPASRASCVDPAVALRQE